MTPEVAALTRFAFFGLVAIGYMVAGWFADDEATHRHRAIIFWITIAAAAIMGTLTHILEAVSK